MPPTIASLNPTNGPVGSHVLISGAGLFPTGVQGVVKFNGTAATILSYNNTGIIAAVPVGATTGNVTVTVVAVGGETQTSNGVAFTVTASATPVIGALTPATGPAGSATVITGSNFGAMQGESTVTFNVSVGPPLVRVVAEISAWSNTSITAIVPPSANTGDVIVTTAGGPSNAETFTIMNPSNGGTAAPIGLLLIPCQQFNTQVVLGFDTTDFDDQSLGSFYSFKVEEVAPGRTPSCTRQIIIYRDLGVASLTASLSGYDQNAQTVVTNSETFPIGTVTATQKLCAIVRGLSLTAQNLQYTLTRAAAGGPVSITKVRLEGRVEATAYA